MECVFTLLSPQSPGLETFSRKQRFPCKNTVWGKHPSFHTLIQSNAAAELAGKLHFTCGFGKDENSLLMETAPSRLDNFLPSSPNFPNQPKSLLNEEVNDPIMWKQGNRKMPPFDVVASLTIGDFCAVVIERNSCCFLHQYRHQFSLPLSCLHSTQYVA